MSLPLTRRIAQAALVVAASAAPLVAAGSASATELVPQTDLGQGVTKLADVPNSGDAVQGAAHEVGQVVGTTGSATLAAGGPALGDAAGNTAAHTLPTDAALEKLGPVGKAGALTGAAGTLSDKVAPALMDKVGPAVTEKVIPATRTATAASPLGTVAKGLPTGGLTQGLPAAGALGPVTGLAKAVPGADALAPVTGLAEHESANRLGSMPALGGGSSPLGGATGALGPITGLLGGGLPGGLPIGG